MSQTEDISGNGDSVNVERTLSSLKLPPFWTPNPEIWFTQVESQFALSRITSDKTKYNYIISNLPFNIISTIYDVITNPPQENLYKILKETIISRLTLSEEKRLDELLSNSELGDRKPSEFYREMLGMVGGSQMVSQDLLIKLWKRRLPKTILVAITASGKDTLYDILDLADKIWETYKPVNISSIHDFPPFTFNNSGSQVKPDSSLDSITELTKAFSEFSINCSRLLQTISDKQNFLESQINSLQSPGPSHCFSTINESTCDFCRHGNRSRSKSPNRSQQSVNNLKICYYHKKFQKNAIRCGGPWCILYETLKHPEPKNE